MPPADAVTAGGMRQADTDLRETLPQVAFFVRTSLPAGLQDLMRSERPAFLHQPPGQVNCLHRRQRLFRNRLDAGSPIGPVSYTHLRAHETVLDLVCRLLLEKKKKPKS